MDRLRFADYRHHVCQVCVCVCVCVYIYKITVVLGLKSRVVTVGIRALGLDPEDN